MRALLQYIILVLFISLTGALQSQSLVPNPDFEQYSTCPTFFSQTSNAVGWGQPPGHSGTSDYFNACASPGSYVSVPGNMAGNVPASSGDGYVGMIVGGEATDPEYREYVHVKLSSPMQAGQLYHFCIKWRRASNSCCAISRLGVAFTNSPSYVQQGANLTTIHETPQIESPKGSYLVDTNQWHAFTGQFTAAGGESFMTIGNFHTGSNTELVRLASNSTLFSDFAYYLIDDIRLDTCPNPGTGMSTNPTVIGSPNDPTQPDFEPFTPNVFTPNGDSLNDVFKVTEINHTVPLQGDLKIFNRWGQQIHQSEGAMTWDGGSHPDGTYYYIAKYGVGNQEWKGVVTLLR